MERKQLESGIVLDLPKETKYESRVKGILSSEREAFTLDLSRKQLLDADVLNDDFQSPSRKTLSHLSLAKNLLVRLNLRGCQTLTTLWASENCILQVRLDLPKLRFVDLSHNSLLGIPDFSRLGYLEEVLLSHNYIQDMDEKMLPCSLAVLDLRSNDITVDESVADFFGTFVQRFRKFPKLQKLNLEKNPFSIRHPNYLQAIADECTLLYSMDENKASDALVARSMRVGVPDGILPTLSKMVACLEQVRKSPMVCGEELNTLSNLVDEARKNPPAFAASCHRDSMESFFEELDILHSSQHKYRKEVYTILAKMVHITQVGSKAMEFLSMYMKSSKELALQVQSAMEESVIRDLVRPNAKLQAYILHDLYLISKEQNISVLLKRTVRPFAHMLIHSFPPSVGTQVSPPKRSKAERDEAEMRMCLLGILAAAFKNNQENVKTVMEKKFIMTEEEGPRIRPEDFVETIKGYLSEKSLEGVELDPDSLKDDEYESIINIIRWCSWLYIPAATLFYEKTYVIFIRYLKKSLDIYTDIAKQEETGDEFSKRVCQRFATEIGCFAVIIDPIEVNVSSVVSKENCVSVIRDLVSLVGSVRIDPLVLAAVCDLAVSLFRSKEVIENDKV